MTYATGRIFNDADGHLVELPDFLSRHADPEMRDALDLNNNALYVGQFGKYAKSAEIARDHKHSDDYRDHLVSLGDGLIAGPKFFGALGAFDPAERSTALDMLGFNTQFVFATFAVPVCLDSTKPVAWRYAAAHTHNRAMGAFCRDDKRLKGVGLLPLDDPKAAAVELEHILEQGLKAVWVPATPAGDRSPGHPDLDPIWARLAETKTAFALHIGAPTADHAIPAYLNNGLQAPVSLEAGGETMMSKDMTAVHQPFEAFLGAMVLDGVFERHPNLRGAVVETGAGWVPAMLKRLDWIVQIWGKPEPRLKEFTRKPSQQIIDQVVFTPYVFEDVADLIRMSDSRLYVFSSDYPHAEGGRAPLERFEKNLAETPEADKQRFYTDNFAKTLSL